MNRQLEPNSASGSRESGAIMLVLTVMLMPLAVISGVFLTTMSARSDRLNNEVREERAFLAAESGLDEAIFRAKTGALYSGGNFTRVLSSDVTFGVEPIHLGSDGVDNDGDFAIDESDEDLFQLQIIGRYGDNHRRLAAYLGPTSLLPPISGAMTTSNPSITIEVSGTSEINGENYNVDGTRGDPADDTAGLAITPPGTTAHLTSELTGGEPARVLGTGGSPSVGLSPAFDLPELVAELRNTASIVLTNRNYSNLRFGDASAGTSFITFRDGDVRFAGTSRGAGILCVTGDLRIVGTLRFDGIIIVLGDVNSAAGTIDVYGGIIQGPGGSELDFRGTAELRYSAEAVDIANSLAYRYVAFNGWQELSRN